MGEASRGRRALIETDSSGRIVSWGADVAVLTGFGDEMIGAPIRQVLDGDTLRCADGWQPHVSVHVIAGGTVHVINPAPRATPPPLPSDKASAVLLRDNSGHVIASASSRLWNTLTGIDAEALLFQSISRHQQFTAALARGHSEWMGIDIIAVGDRIELTCSASRTVANEALIAAFTHLAGAAALIDAAQRVVLATPSFRELFAVAPGERFDVQIELTEPDRPLQHPPGSVLRHIIAKDGTGRTLRWHSVPLFMARSEYTLIDAMDITPLRRQQRRWQDEATLTMRLIEQLNGPIVVTDRSGHVLFASENAAARLGQERDELIGTVAQLDSAWEVRVPYRLGGVEIGVIHALVEGN